MSNLAKNVAYLLEKRGMNQAQLAAKAEVDTATINRVMKGKAFLISESLPLIAKALGVTPAELIAEYPNIESAELGSRRIPVWDYVQAGRWAGVAPYLRDEEMQDFVLTDEEYSEGAFALKIKGDSMEPEFRTGDIVVVDPEVKPHPGDFVVAKDEKGEATFKKFRPRGLNDAGKEYFLLEPLNPDYEPMRSDLQQIIIVGTMVEHRKYRRR